MRLVLFLTLTLAVPAAHAQTVWYVDADATGANTGTSWADAFPDLQDALAAAEAEDEIWVAEGTYRPSTTSSAVSFQMQSGVGIYGGFAGTEHSRGERDWDAHPTILSGMPSQVVVRAVSVDTAGVLDGFTITDARVHGMHVEDGAPVLRHLLFLDNVAIGSSTQGGALFVQDGAPRLDSLRFEGSSAARGGAVYVAGGQVHIASSTFYNNTATPGIQRGSALYVERGEVHLRHSAFDDNTASYDGSYEGGGAIYLEDGTLDVFGTTVTGNYGFQGGGFVQEGGVSLFDSTAFVGNEGVWAGGARVGGGSATFRRVHFEANDEGGASLSGSVLVEDSEFLNNRATFSGGGLSASGSVVLLRTRIANNRSGTYGYASGGGLQVGLGEVTLIDCEVRSNTAQAENKQGPEASEAYGGGISVFEGTLRIMNSVISNNLVVAYGGLGSASAGGGIYLKDGSLVLTSSTVAQNRGLGGNGVMAWVDDGVSSVTITNSIIWGNEGAPDLRVLPGVSTFVYRSLVDGGIEGGIDMLDEDPLFVQGYHLRYDSPAIDFGNVALLPPDTFDLDGDGDTAEPLPLDLDGGPRVLGTSVDLGAYESPFTVATDPQAEIPTAFRLVGASPNPFNPAARIAFDLPEAAEVELAVFDVLGRRVRTLGPVPMAAGANRSLTLNGRGLASGLYLYRLTVRMGETTRAASGSVTLLR